MKSYEQLSLENARLADQLEKALESVTLWQMRAINAEIRMNAVSKQIDHEITLLQQPIHLK